MTKTSKKPKLIGCVGHDCEACKRTKRDAKIILRKIQKTISRTIFTSEEAHSIYLAAKRIAARGERR